MASQHVPISDFRSNASRAMPQSSNRFDYISEVPLLYQNEGGGGFGGDYEEEENAVEQGESLPSFNGGIEGGAGMSSMFIPKGGDQL